MTRGRKMSNIQVTTTSIKSAPRRGRPQVLPWDREMQYLIEARKSGATYGDLAYELALRYRRPVTPQTVKANVAPLMSTSAEKESERARVTEQQEKESIEALRIAEYIVENQQSSKMDIADGLGIPPYRVDKLYKKAKQSMDGYILPPVREGKQKFTSDQMEGTLRAAARALEIPENGQMSEGAFNKWRDSLASNERDQIPNSMVYRRRYGTWTDACQAAGLKPNPLPRQYDGVSRDDCVVWLAHWLRSLTDRGEGLIEASQGEYAMWLRNHPDAPSQDMLLLRDAWSVLLAEASDYEREHRNLLAPKPVQTSGRNKKQR